MAQNMWENLVFDVLIERDINILLLEEMRLSAAFQAWLVDKLSNGQKRLSKLLNVTHLAANVELGTVDILFLFEDEHAKRCAFLIENKMDRPREKVKAGRYFEYGEKGVYDGAWDEYLTCLIAPSDYFSELSETEYFSGYLSYEDLADWFVRAQTEDPSLPAPRAAYKEHLMRFALSQWHNITQGLATKHKTVFAAKPVAPPTAQRQPPQQPPAPVLSGVKPPSAVPVRTIAPVADNAPEYAAETPAPAQDARSLMDVDAVPAQTRRFTPAEPQPYTPAPLTQQPAFEPMPYAAAPAQSVPMPVTMPSAQTPYAPQQQTAPVYENPAPAYENQTSVYDNPAPVYENQAPVYDNPAPVYEEPAPQDENLSQTKDFNEFKLFPGGILNLPKDYREEDDSVMKVFARKYAEFAAQTGFAHLNMQPVDAPDEESFTIVFHPAEFIPDVKILHRLAAGCVDLVFLHTPLNALETLYRPFLTDDMSFKESDGFSAVRIGVPEIDAQRGLESQKDLADFALKKAHKLYLMYLQATGEPAAQNVPPEQQAQPYEQPQQHFAEPAPEPLYAPPAPKANPVQNLTYAEPTAKARMEHPSTTPDDLYF